MRTPLTPPQKRQRRAIAARPSLIRRALACPALALPLLLCGCTENQPLIEQGKASLTVAQDIAGQTASAPVQQAGNSTDQVAALPDPATQDSFGRFRSNPLPQGPVLFVPDIRTTADHPERLLKKVVKPTAFVTSSGNLPQIPQAAKDRDREYETALAQQAPSWTALSRDEQHRRHAQLKARILLGIAEASATEVTP